MVMATLDMTMSVSLHQPAGVGTRLFRRRVDHTPGLFCVW